MRDEQPHLSRQDCQIASRENNNAGMSLIAIGILVPLAFLVVGSEIVSRAPRPISRSGTSQNYVQIGLVFVVVAIASLLLIFLADRFCKRK